MLSNSAKSAFETAYDRYADMMFRVALSHLGVREDAEDAVHDVFIKFVQSEPHFESDEHEKAWLLRATINRCRDLHRRRDVRHYAPLDELGELPDQDGERDGGHIITLVSALPPHYKSVIVLHCLEGYSVEQTAATLNISVSAAKMRLSRGRDILKNKMKKEGI